MSNDKIDLDKLSNALNNVLSKPTPLKKKEKIALGDWLELKKALNPINNFITKELTIDFINKLPKILSGEIKNYISDLVKTYRDGKNVNGNGYDIEEKDLHIIAEVKANIPYGGIKYGASQKSGLKKDLDGLLDPLKKKGGEKREKKELETLKKCYKFLVVLNYNQDNYNTPEAVEDLKKGYKDNKKIEIINDKNKHPKLETDKVYIVMLEL